MRFAAQLRESWTDIFVPDNLHQASPSADTPGLVDIGGGVGTEVLQFRQRYPHLTGRIILQELPSVIAAAKENLAGQVIITRTIQ